VDPYGGWEAISRTANASFVILAIPERETNGSLKRKGMHKLCTPASIHYKGRSDSAYPIHTESTFIMASIAASKRRVERCYDVPKAFVNMDVNEDIIMVLKSKIVEMMIQIAPEVYRKYVTIDWTGTTILYVKLQKALCRLMRASLLFYRKLRKEF
jgi:hypothetical protein